MIIIFRKVTIIVVIILFYSVMNNDMLFENSTIIINIEIAASLEDILYSRHCNTTSCILSCEIHAINSNARYHYSAFKYKKLGFKEVK